MERFRASIFVVSAALLVFASALNEEGVALLRFREAIEVDPYGSLANWVASEGEENPCLWNGVGCDRGRVISLMLEDRCLKGILSPELGRLVHLKYLILHNNSFYGSVPKEFAGLVRLEILDLGYNNLDGLFPSDLGNLNFLEILVIKGNNFLDTLPSLIQSLDVHGDFYVRANHLSLFGKHTSRFGDIATARKLLQDGLKQTSIVAPASSSRRMISSGPVSTPSSLASAPSSIPTPSPAQNSSQTPKKNKTAAYIAIGVLSAVIVLALVFIIFTRGKRIVTVKPWATGLSGQLRDALKTGAPSLNRAEIEAACEDFSNIIGSLSDGKLYKGTLSSGVEIAVSVLTPGNGWSKMSEKQFRNKVDNLSRLNHKNFVNLLGYCEEEEPFSRMMVYEYAPNGTLFEHLHIRETQDLNWTARMRIAMGVAYCLEHMHQLSPPIALKELNSNMIYLTDDFAAKVADLEVRTSDFMTYPETPGSQILDQWSIVRKFGVLLLELVSGKPLYSDEDGGLVTWANDYLKGLKPLKYMVDPSLDSFDELNVTNVINVARDCLNPDPRRRLSMMEVVTRLRDATSITSEGAAPKLSPLWWAELEIISSEG